MGDVISVRVSENHFVNCATEVIARQGEGLNPRLVFDVPETLTGYWPYLDFKKPSGETFKTPRLTFGGNNIVYDIPTYLLTEKGELEVQLVLQDENGVVWKSYTKTFFVRYSINAVDDIPDKEDFITEAQRLLDEIEETMSQGGGGGGGASIDVDAELDINSTNPVQNKVVTEEIYKLESRVGDVATALDVIIDMQNTLIGSDL